VNSFGNGANGSEAVIPAQAARSSATSARSAGERHPFDPAIAADDEFDRNFALPAHLHGQRNDAIPILADGVFNILQVWAEVDALRIAKDIYCSC
jgi:hypothetical protein